MKPIYKFTLENKTSIHLNSKTAIEIANKYPNYTWNFEWLSIQTKVDISAPDTLPKNTELVLTFEKGYSWDGCSPKFKLGQNIIGAWDGFFSVVLQRQTAYLGSLIHDGIYQYKGKHGISRKEADKLLRETLIKDGFTFPNFYFLMVRIFGGFFAKRGN